MDSVLSISLSEFTPAELERIAGIGPEVQRVWRARGYIPRSEGAHARYSPLIVASLMVRKALTNFGVGHRETTGLSYQAAPHVFRWALEQPGAWTLSSLKGVVLADDRATQTPSLLKHASGLTEQDLRRFIVRAEDNDAQLVSDAGSAFSGAASGFYIDLEALGRNLVDRAGRPLLQIMLSGAHPLE